MKIRDFIDLAMDEKDVFMQVFDLTEGERVHGNPVVYEGYYPDIPEHMIDDINNAEICTWHTYLKNGYDAICFNVEMEG